MKRCDDFPDTMIIDSNTLCPLAKSAIQMLIINNNNNKDILMSA